MTQADADQAATSPEFRRGLALAWIGLVAVVGVCMFLAMWWNVNGVRSAEAATATAQRVASLTPPATQQAAVGLVPTELPTQPTDEVTSGETPTPLPAADLSFGYGVQVQALTRTDETLDRAQQLGMGWVRQPVSWREVEVEPGAYDWTALDAFFAATTARNLKVMVTISAAPDWTRSVTAPERDGPPDDPMAYATFVAALVQRYKGAVHGVEVWSEMNRDEGWYVAGGLRTADYMALLTPTAQMIRAVDPGILISSGGLNPTGIDDGVMAIDDFRYLRELIADGLLEVVDCVGVHHQGYNIPPDVPYYDVNDTGQALQFRDPFDNRHHSWSFYSTVRGYNDMIVAAGAETPLCVTEFGWATVGELPREDMPAFVLDNTLQDQADYDVQAFRLMREWGFVRMAVVANLDFTPQDAETPDDSLTAYYRIVTADGRPRPAFEALLTMPKE